MADCDGSGILTLCHDANRDIRTYQTDLATRTLPEGMHVAYRYGVRVAAALTPDELTRELAPHLKDDPFTLVSRFQIPIGDPTAEINRLDDIRRTLDPYAA